ncbi:hypothetical protein [Crossiella cryophila]|uniref:NB-ARC domain-containing protein n=1 Tax=Crossiella cryophila TaxID=43355 RepID=A0A7W7CF11_9PSEU|nr:hypothetical protein [Crossiella cryophila]MBB4679787.1 hypothetical protein [Crossiella cryophila]
MSEHEFVAPILDPPGDGNLPGTPPPFVGRTEELARLTELVERGTAVPIVISGLGGVGKTSLVLHWASQNEKLFRGGQIIFRTAVLPMRRLLARLGVDHAAIPEGLAAQLRLYRETTRTRRVLVVLDGIENPALVRRLLSGAPAITVLITSRITPDNAVTLPPLPIEEGYPRLSAASPAASALLELLCAAPGPDFSLHTIAALSTGDPLLPHRSALELAHLGLLENRRSRHWIPDWIRPLLLKALGAPRTVHRRRIADCYLQTAVDADRLLSPARSQLTPPMAEEVIREHLDDAREALTWFDAEHANLLAVQQLCLREGWSEHAWQLAWALETYHRRRGLLGDPATTWHAAVDTARLLEDSPGISVVRQVLADLDDPVGEATWEVLALEGIAAVNAELGDFEGARRNWDRVRDLRRGPVTEVTVYTTDNVGEPLRDAVVELLQVAGFAVTGKDTPIRGSWFQRLRVRGDAKAVDKLGELAGKLERAAELKYIATPRSENDEREANAIAKLAEAMKDVDEVIIRTSSVLFVKTAGCVMSIVLSEEQIRCLDRNPQLMQAPAKVLDALAELVRGEPVPLAVEGQTG